MNRARFLVKSFGDNLEGAKVGLIKLLEVLEENKTGVIVVPQLQNIKDTILTGAIGAISAKKLIKEREIVFSDGRKIKLCSYSNLKNYKDADAYLALWGSKDTIAAIEPLYSWKALILVTWTPKDSERWEEGHEVAVIYDDGRKEL